MKRAGFYRLLRKWRDLIKSEAGCRAAEPKEPRQANHLPRVLPQAPRLLQEYASS